MQPSHLVDARRNPDGGFGPVKGADSEPEPTALVAIAWSDAEASAWLEAEQRADGSVGIAAGEVFRDLTAVACLSMRSPSRVAEGVRWVQGFRARPEAPSDAVPHDPSTRGWSWTSNTFGWTEPTAWGILALRALGHEGPEVDDGVALLRDRECVGGGWNYGNRLVLGEALPPFVQPTALALLALRGLSDPLADRGLNWLRSGWEVEADGLLSAATAAAALRSFGAPESAAAAVAVRAHVEADPDVDTIALAWAAIALGDGLDRLEVG